MTRALFALVFCLVTALPAQALSLQRILGKATAVSSSRKVAVVLGNNVGLATEVQLRYAEDDARRVARVLSDLGGFAPHDVNLLLGGTNADVRQLLAKVKAELAGAENPLVFLYYSGHGSGDTLHLSGTRLPMDALQRFLDDVDGAVRIALIDSCKSGAFVRSKGLTPGPSFDIDVLRDPSVSGKIVITSSSADEVAQESDLLGGSFFTHYWVSGLYGQADSNGDRLVTLEEAYRFAHFMTVNKTIEASAGVQHPSYLFSLSGEGTIVLANLTQSTARIDIENSAGGQYFILDANKHLVLTELIKTGPGRASVRLPPGSYQVRKREDGQLLEVDVQVKGGQTATVSDAQMRPVSYLKESTKGGYGVRARLLGTRAHGVAVLFGASSGLVSEMGAMPSARVGYRLDWRFLSVEPRAVLRSGVIDGSLAKLGFGELDVGASVGPRVVLGRVVLSGGVDVGVAFFRQVLLSGSPLAALAPALPARLHGGGFGDVELALFGPLRARARVDVGAAVFGGESEYAAPVLYPTVAASAGLAWAF